ncbi:hypothetical protein GQ53DRAFT_749296 [Thozetella sp. PMI_491]|nr:hypothetical protein GQ53DRAFT_749296 [Thozetella sp. PMI_491]
MASPDKPNTVPQEAHPPQAERIPPLTSIAPCVFTPLTEDITKPSSQPLDRIEHLKRIIEAIDIQTAAVRDNLMWMLDRERQRIIQEAQAAEAAEGLPDVRPGLPTDEADRIIASMLAPANPRVEYNLPQLSNPIISQLPPAGSNATVRERALHDIMILAEKAVDQLAGYDSAMSLAKKGYLNQLDAERWRFQKAGGGQSRDQTMADGGPM